MKKCLMLLILMVCVCFAGCRKNGEEKKTSDHHKASEETAQKVTEEAAADKEKKIMIAIDPGHQKEQMTDQEPIGPGASETKPKVASGTQGVVTKEPEYQVTLQVSQKLKQVLKTKGYDVYMIRETNDVELSNRERAQMANGSGASVFLRLHCNGDDNSSVNGALTMCPTESNPYCSEIAGDSLKLSEVIVSSLCQSTGAKNRGVIRTDQMSGINWCEIPVTIVEMGFMSNPEEDRKLVSESYQEKLAKGIAEGVDQYFKQQKEDDE